MKASALFDSRLVYCFGPLCICVSHCIALYRSVPPCEHGVAGVRPWGPRPPRPISRSGYIGKLLEPTSKAVTQPEKPETLQIETTSKWKSKAVAAGSKTTSKVGNRITALLSNLPLRAMDHHGAKARPKGPTGSTSASSATMRRVPLPAGPPPKTPAPPSPPAPRADARSTAAASTAVDGVRQPKTPPAFGLLGFIKPDALDNLIACKKCRQLFSKTELLCTFCGD